MAQVGDYLFIDENNNAYVVHKENFAAVDDTSKCVAVVFALETSYEDKKKGYKHGYAMALKNAGKDIPYGEPDKTFQSNGIFPGLPRRAQRHTSAQQGQETSGRRSRCKIQRRKTSPEHERMVPSRNRAMVRHNRKPWQGTHALQCRKRFCVMAGKKHFHNRKHKHELGKGREIRRTVQSFRRNVPKQQRDERRVRLRGLLYG